MRAGVVEHRAPFRRGRLRAETQEVQARDAQDYPAYVQGGDDDDRPHDVGGNVAQDDAEAAGARSARRSNIFLLPGGQGDPADDAGMTYPPDCARRQQHIEEARPQRAGHRQRQYQRRESQQQVHYAHQGSVQPAAVVS